MALFSAISTALTFWQWLGGWPVNEQLMPLHPLESNESLKLCKAALNIYSCIWKVLQWSIVSPQTAVSSLTSLYKHTSSGLEKRRHTEWQKRQSSLQCSPAALTSHKMWEDDDDDDACPLGAAVSLFANSCHGAEGSYASQPPTAPSRGWHVCYRPGQSRYEDEMFTFFCAWFSFREALGHVVPVEIERQNMSLIQSTRSCGTYLGVYDGL